MKISDLTAKTKTVSFDYDGETVNMDVHTQLITPKMAAELNEVDDDKVDAATRMHTLSDLASRLIAHWDVLNDDGSMFPLDTASLEATIPVMFLSQALMESVKAALPGEASAAA